MNDCGFLKVEYDLACKETGRLKTGDSETDGRET